MLSRENRLTLGKDFDLVYKNGRFFSSENVSLKVASNKLNTIRIGFSIGIKFSSTAVARNQAKRWLRDIVRKHLEEMKSGCDIVIMLKKEATEPTYQKLEQSLKNALQRGNLLIK